jgi:hypothetical protein
MADNSIDLVVSKEAFKQLDDLLKEIKKADDAITALNTNAGKNPTTPSGGEANAAENAKIIAQMKELNAEIARQASQIKKLEEARKASSRAITQDTIDNRASNAVLTQNLQLTSEKIGAYQKLDIQYKQAIKTAQDLGAAENKLTNGYIAAAAKAKELGLQLQAIDSSVGKYGRNVGNYASGWNGLANSVNQITREAPAFANSLNTGFMALSNNIPILADEINNLKIKNQELAATGKPTESIVATLAKSFFSWQTVLSVGVTLLTLYGSKLVDMARGLGDVEAAMDSIKKSQKDSNSVIEDTTRNILHQAEVRKNIAKSQGATDRELFNMDKEAQAQVLKNLEAIRDKSVEAFNTVVDYRNKNYEDVKTKVSAELELEGKKDKSSAKYAALTAQRAKELRQMASRATDENAKLLLNDAIARENAVKLQAQKIAKMAFFEKETSKQRRERMAIDFSEEKSIHDLRLAQLERERQAILNMLNAYKISSQERLDLEMELQAKEYDILVEKSNKEKALISEKAEDDRKRNDLQLKNSKNSLKDRQLYSSNIVAINDREKNELLTVDVNFNKETEKLDAEALKRNLVFRAKMKEQSVVLRQAELDEAITKNKLIADDAVKNEEQTLKQRQIAFDGYIKLTKEKIKIEELLKLSQAVDPLEKQKIEEHYKAIAKALDNISSPVDNANKALKELASSFATAFSSSSISPTFLKMFEGNESLFKRIQDGSAFTKESWAADTTQMMEAAQEMYNFISNASQANFDAEYARLDSQKEIAIKFAGDSTSAKEKVEQDYEKRRKEIAIREFKAKKQQSIVNIAIDTAQAIIGAIAKSPLTLGMPWSAAIAALGAIQIGVVAAQKVPQYFEGTDNHPGGLALINDGKGANFKETVVTPDGKVRQYSGRDVLIDAPAGTQVFTHDQWNNELNTMMREKGISMSNSFTSKSGLTYQEMDSIIAKHFSKITTQSTVIDRNGFNTFVSSGASKTIRNQSRYSGTGFSV